MDDITTPQPAAEAAPIEGEPSAAPYRRPKAPPIDASPWLVDYDRIAPPVSWREIFGDDRPVELEIGSGKGLFLANEAARRPGVNFFGIEIAKKYARAAAERVAKRRLNNVRVLPGDARLFLERHAPENSLHAIHVYFPDPWWKKRHRKRRVFCEGLVIDMERVLRPDSDLWVATDVEEYFGVIQKLMDEHPRFERRAEPAPTPGAHDLDYLTNFERKYRIEGRPIHRAHYRFDGA